MSIPMKKRTQLEAALESSARLSRRDHDRGSRLGDRIFIIAVAAAITVAYLAVSANDQHVADIENQQRQQQAAQ